MTETRIGERLGAIATSTLANALDRVRRPYQIMTGLKPIAPGFRFVGTAVTVREESGPFETFDGSEFRVGAMIDAAEPGQAIVVSAGGAPYSTWGGMASLAAAVKGIAGIVVDGGVRDRDETVEAGFPVFARHLVPTTGRTRLRVAAIGDPVTVDGVLVNPGDWIVADDTGVLAIPVDCALEVVEMAEKFTKEDAEAATAIRAGMPFSEAMRRYGNI